MPMLTVSQTPQSTAIPIYILIINRNNRNCITNFCQFGNMNFKASLATIESLLKYCMVYCLLIIYTKTQKKISKKDGNDKQLKLHIHD